MLDHAPMGSTHLTPHVVRFHELDPYDHVNHAAYVTFFEIGRTDALEAIDLGLGSLKESGYQFVVTKLEVRFRGAATFGDVLTISTAVSATSRATTTWTQQITAGDRLIASAEVTVAVTDTTGKPVRPPEWILEGLDPLTVN